MQLPDHNISNYRWDRYETMHVVDQGFVDFLDGTSIYTDGTPEPNVRRKYGYRNVQITMTTDPDCPALSTPAGEEVPKAWLNQKGGQYLMIDWDFKIAVGLRQCSPYSRVRYHAPTADADPDTRWLPTWLIGQFACYWPGMDRRPIGASIELSRPMDITTEQRRMLLELRDQIRTWIELRGIDTTDVTGGLSTATVRVGSERVSVPRGAISMRLMLNKTIADLDIPTRLQLHNYGYLPQRDKSHVGYLTAKPR